MRPTTNRHAGPIRRPPFRVSSAVAWVLLAAALASAPAAGPAPSPSPAPGPVPPEAMKDVSLEGLTPGQKTLVVSLLNDYGCDCGCGMKVAVCRRDDAKCTRSLAIANQVIGLAKQGKGRDEIVKAALTPPTKFVQFDLAAGDSPAVGPPNAKVTILYYFDYQCPFCAKIEPTLAQILKDYPQDVRVVFKMHPLAMHQNAQIAAEAAMAAMAQGKFQEMHRKLFENQTALGRDRILAVAKEIGLDVDRFTKDLDSHAMAPRIAKEAKEVEDLGVTGTPATFVNGRYLSGAKPYATFKDVVDEEVGWAKAANRPAFKTGKNVSETMVRQSPAGPDPNKLYALPAGDAPFRGPASAKVTILHYFDYQCPFCSRVAPTLDKVLADYPRDVRVVFKMHPLAIHPNAMLAAQAAMAAKAQGKFFEMHAKLFESPQALSRDKVVAYAKELGLDVRLFTADLDGNAHKATIDAETQEVVAVGATGTPASFVNGRFLSGAQPYEAFKKVVDEELAKAAPPVKAP